MTQYALYFKKDTNLPLNWCVFQGENIPPLEVTPPGCELVSFDELSKDFDILYALYVEDPEKKYFDYDMFTTTYNFETKEFSFQKKVIPSNLEQIRAERNAKIAYTDDLVLAPDIPDELKNSLLEYRQALRDITDGLDPDTSSHDVKWPELPIQFVQTTWKDS